MATRGPGWPDARGMKPRMPVFPATHGAISGAVMRTSNAGTGGCVLRDIGPAMSGQQPIGQAADEYVTGIKLILRYPFVRLVRLGNMARSANYRRDAGTLVVAALGAVTHFA